jgi:hypothetical protein
MEGRIARSLAFLKFLREDPSGVVRLESNERAAARKHGERSSCV